MTYLRILYNTIWFRVHPIGTSYGRTIYPTWRASWKTAKILYL